MLIPLAVVVADMHADQQRFALAQLGYCPARPAQMRMPGIKQNAHSRGACCGNCFQQKSAVRAEAVGARRYVLQRERYACLAARLINQPS